MSDPYRIPGGTPCPRCESPLVRERDDELVCANGCGTWLGNARLPIDPAELPPISRGNPSRATALPFTRCLVCKHSLNDLYKGDRTVLVVGQCLEHGIWIEHGDGNAFEAAYADEIPSLAEERARREAEAQAAAAAARAQQRAEELREKRAQELASMPEIVQELVRRVSLLERQIQDLKRQIEKLS